MDGHVILTRHGLRVAVRCAVGEGEKKERSALLFLHFGWAAVIGRGVSLCFSSQIALRAPYAFAYELSSYGSSGRLRRDAYVAVS